MGRGRRAGKGAGGLWLACLAALALPGCSDSLPSLPKLDQMNPFKENVPPLPGKRIAILPTQETMPGELAAAAAPIALPPPRANESWSQPGGEANNAPGHLELAGAVHQSWTADAGTGSSKVGRVTASPIIYDGRIYTLDANGQVSAFSLSGGSAVWRASLAPTVADNGGGFSFNTNSFFSLGGTDGGAYGGGIAADGGRLYGASGYGTVVAMNPANGARLWEKNLGAPVRASPTAAGERVFVVTTEGILFCLSGVDGTELWSARGLPQQASLILNASPAVDGDLVVAPFASGDLVALRIVDGSSAWSDSLSRSRTTSQLTSLSDAARPAIDGGMVFAIGHGGRMIAAAETTGERLWSLNVPGTQMPLVAGETVFVVDTSGQLMAITRRDGKIQWTAKLPDSNNWAGPTLAGGQLWLASSKGTLIGVDAGTGRIASQLDLGTAVFIAPIVAQGHMFVLADDAKLIALN